MHGSVFLDETGRSSAPPCSGTTSERPTQCAEIEDRAGGREALIRMVGNPALTGFTAPKLLWVREHEPKNWERVRQVLLPKDYIRFRLTGDIRHGGQRRLRHAAARRGQPPLESRAARQARPRPRPAARVLREPGGLGDGQRDRLGGDRPGEGDAGRRRRRRPAGRARWATASSAPGVVSATMGTSGVVFAHTDEPGFDPLGRLQRGCHAVPGAWHVMGVVLSAGGSFRGSATSSASWRSRPPRPRASTPIPAHRGGRAWPRPAPRGCSSCPT